MRYSLTILLLFFSSLFCLGNTIADANKDNVVLNRDKTFRDQLIRSNTIYEIRFNFDLKGGTVEIPSGCTLNFQGGSITNGRVVLNDCYIDGQASFDCSFSGDIANDYFDATWMSAGRDIGVKLNYAQKFFKRLRTPYREYTFSTPIKIEKATKIYLDGVFTFKGKPTNNNSAIEIINTSNCTIHLTTLQMALNVLDYSDKRKINFIGLCLTSCNNVYVFCQTVSLFNENIRFQDIYGRGSAYNKVLCLQNNNANIGIRFYADDTYGESWCNETAVLGGRFASFNYGFRFGTQYGIVIAGPAFDNPGYKNSKKNNKHDSSSNISIQNASFEGLDIGIYARNVSGLNIWACREEDVPTFVKIAGYIWNFSHQIGYAPGTYDLSESTEFSVREFNQNNSITIPIRNDLSYPRSAFGNVLCSDSEVLLDTQVGSYLTSTGVILKTTKSKQFGIGFYDKNNRLVSVGGNTVCKYLGKDGKTLVKNMSEYPAPNRYSYYAKAQKNWAYSNSINVPEDIDYIFVGLANNSDSSVDHMVVWSLGPIEAITTEKSVMGSFDKKPASLPLGISYFDTTNNRPIYWTGNKWVDASGKEL